MTRRLAALTALALVLPSGCAQQAGPPPPPPPTSFPNPFRPPTSPPPTGTDGDRAVCAKLHRAWGRVDMSRETNASIAAEALRSPTPTILAAGSTLQAATRSTMDGGPDIATIAKAQLTFYATCESLFGEGNW